MIQTREQVLQSDCWNVEALYPSFSDWEADYKKHFSDHKTPRWPELRQFQGQLSQGPQTIRECLEFLFATQRTIEKLYTYAHLRHDEEIADDRHKTAYQKMMAIYHEFAQEASWFEPELLSLSADAIDRILDAPEIESYRFYLEKIVRLKDHTLSPENEMLMALSGKALQTAHKAS